MTGYFIVKQNSSSNMSLALEDNAPSKPYLVVKSHGYIPLTDSNTNLPGLKVKVNGSVLRAVEVATETYMTTTEATIEQSSTYTALSTTWRSDTYSLVESVGASKTARLSASVNTYSQLTSLQAGMYSVSHSYTLGENAKLSVKSWWIKFGYTNGSIVSTAIKPVDGINKTKSSTWEITAQTAVGYGPVPSGAQMSYTMGPMTLTVTQASYSNETVYDSLPMYYIVGYEDNTSQVLQSSTHGVSYAALNKTRSTSGINWNGKTTAVFSVSGQRAATSYTNIMSTYTQPSPELTATYTITTESVTQATRTVTR